MFPPAGGATALSSKNGGAIAPPNGPVAQLVRALACHARGRGFDPHPDRHLEKPRESVVSIKIQPLLYASVAQLVEQGTENPRVVGSIPTGGTIPRI